jgi:hypothetical protein
MFVRNEQSGQGGDVNQRLDTRLFIPCIMFVRNELSGQVGDVNQRLDTRLQQRDVDSINRISKLAGKLFLFIFCCT